MIKRLLVGTLTLIVLAFAVIFISVVQFDVPREQLIGRYAGGCFAICDASFRCKRAYS